MEDAEGFRDVFVKLLQQLNQTQLVQFAMTAWSIWTKRNLKLWENKHETVDQVLNRAKGVLFAWQAAQKNHSQTDVTGSYNAQLEAAVETWKPPPAGYVKCNIDAAIFSADCKVSMGAVLRDNAGQFIAAVSDWYMAAMTAADAWSLLKGLQWIASYNYQHVIIELDCQQVVNDVCTNKLNCSEYGLIVQNCKTFLRNHNNYKVVFARRKANGSAHTLARATLSHASHVIFDVIPTYIAPIIINEMT